MSTDPMPTVWVAEWRDGDEHPEDCESLYALFDTREAAVASCPAHGEVREIAIRREPLATQTRWKGEVFGDGTVSKPSEYLVNELQYEFGKPLTPFGASLRCCHAPSRGEVLAYLRKVAEPIKEAAKETAEWARWAARTDAECNQDFSCPEHGHLGRHPIGSAMPCKPCRRWVDKDGNRFGHYGTTVDGQHSFSLTPSNGYDEGPL